MLEVLKIENFKAFRRLEVSLRPLTLLAGVNGVGKSTVIQSLLLLRQSYASWPRLEGEMARVFLNVPQLFPLVLNGNLIQLGSFQDVLSRNAEELTISIALQDNNAPVGLIPFRFDGNTLDSSVL